MTTLPKDISYQKLYTQNIWLLNWILKQQGSYPYLNQIILSMPFTVKRYYYTNNQLHYLKILKNGLLDGMCREWFKNGKLKWETNWKNSQPHGLCRGWYENGKPMFEKIWKNGEQISEKYY